MDGTQKSFKIDFKRREYATLVIILLILIAGAIYKPSMFTGPRLIEMISSVLLWLPLIVTVGVGMLMVIIIRGIDISVGSMIALVGMTIGGFYRDFNMSIPVAFIVSVVIGFALGAFNGYLISYLKIPSLIVTLATMNLYRGMSMLVSGSYEIHNADMPRALDMFVQKSVLGIPYLTWMTIIVVVVMWFVLKYSHFGREVYALGSNEEAARLRGINVKKVRFLVFALTGLFAGIASFMYGARYATYQSATTGLGFEFVVISATVIGGASMRGGSGTVFGVVLGSILLGTIQTLIPMVGLSGFFYKACYGLIIVIALLIDKTIESRQQLSIATGGYRA